MQVAGGCSSESTLPHNNTSRLLHYADVILGTSKPEKLEPSKPIPYQRLGLGANWESYDIHHDLTDLGIKKFVRRSPSTLKRVAA